MDGVRRSRQLPPERMVCRRQLESAAVRDAEPRQARHPLYTSTQAIHACRRTNSQVNQEVADAELFTEAHRRGGPARARAHRKTFRVPVRGSRGRKKKKVVFSLFLGSLLSADPQTPDSLPVQATAPPLPRAKLCQGGHRSGRAKKREEGAPGTPAAALPTSSSAAGPQLQRAQPPPPPRSRPPPTAAAGRREKPRMPCFPVPPLKSGQEPSASLEQPRTAPATERPPHPRRPESRVPCAHHRQGHARRAQGGGRQLGAAACLPQDLGPCDLRSGASPASRAHSFPHQVVAAGRAEQTPARRPLRRDPRRHPRTRHPPGTQADIRHSSHNAPSRTRGPQLRERGAEAGAVAGRAGCVKEMLDGPHRRQRTPRQNGAHGQARATCAGAGRADGS